MLPTFVLKILLGLLFSLIIISIILVILLRPTGKSNKTLACNSFSNLSLGTFPCGLAFSSDDAKSHFVVGRILKENDKFIDLMLTDTSGNALTQRFSYVKLEKSVTLTGVPNGDFSRSDPISWPSDMLSAYESSLLLSEGEEIVTAVSTPSREEIRGIDWLSKKDVSCLSYNDYFIKYLKEPNYIGRFKLILGRYLQGCNVLLSQIYYSR